MRFSNVSQVIDEMRQAWKASTSNLPFNYFFLDNYFERNYKSDTTFSSLFLFFSAFAIFIACLGLFGLVSYTTLQRAKEIGIRKVLGASIRNILILLSKDFAIVIFIAGLVTIPLIGFTLSRWLESYAFRISLSVQLFLFPMILIFLVSMITVIIRSLTVATSSPVNSLRSE
jgi:putative ABC transport system permease protein